MKSLHHVGTYDTKVVIAFTADKITKIQPIKGKTVGVKQYCSNASSIKARTSTATRSRHDTGDLMYSSLSAGAVDAVMDDQPVIQYAIKVRTAINRREAVGGFCLWCKKGGKHEKLITEFNKTLAQMKADGTLDEIIRNGRK